MSGRKEEAMTFLTFPVTGDLQYIDLLRWTIGGFHTSTDYFMATCNTVNKNGGTNIHCNLIVLFHL